MTHAFSAHSRQRRRSERGIALMEVLMSVLVISASVLGLSALTTRAHKQAQNAYWASEASMILNDISERLIANRVTAVNSPLDYQITSSGGSQACGGSQQTSVANPNASPNGQQNSSNSDDNAHERARFARPTGLTVPQIDQWQARCLAKLRLPGGTISVEPNVTSRADQYTVTVSWNEASSDSQPQTRSLVQVVKLR